LPKSVESGNFTFAKAVIRLPVGSKSSVTGEKGYYYHSQTYYNPEPYYSYGPSYDTRRTAQASTSMLAAKTRTNDQCPQGK